MQIDGKLTFMSIPFQCDTTRDMIRNGNGRDHDNGYTDIHQWIGLHQRCLS